MRKLKDNYAAIAAALALVVALVSVPGADASSSKVKNKYVLHGKHCKRGYQKVKRPHKKICVKRRTKPSQIELPRTVRLQAHLSPTVKRNPLNPFQVTYGMSASATSEAAAGAAIVSEPTPPPAGVLALYNDGVLACAVNVGPQTVGDECPVTYEALGIHRVTTIYTAGSVSAADTDLVDVEPITTTTSLTTTFTGQPPHELNPGEWQVGTLLVNAASSPGGPQPTLSCTSQNQPACVSTPALVNGVVSLPVLARVGGFVGNQPVFDVGIPKAFPTGSFDWFPATDIEAGSHFLHATTVLGAEGYRPSEASTPIQFALQALPGFFNAQGLSLQATEEFAPMATLGTYVKKGASTDLHLRFNWHATEGEAGCLVQARVNGVPIEGDIGGVVDDHYSEVNLSFPDIAPGPANLEIWTRYVGAGEPLVCDLIEAGFVASE